MLKSANLIYICGIISILFLSTSLINYTSKAIFGFDKIRGTKATNYIYDPDYELNYTLACLTFENFHKIPYNDTPCANTTQLSLYIPWVRHWQWKAFETAKESQMHKREIKTSNQDNKAAVSEPNHNLTETRNDEIAQESQKLDSEKVQTENPKEKSSEIVYTILVGILIISTLLACWEVFREKLMKNHGEGIKVQEKECSLAEFTMIRHLRRESSIQGPHLERQDSFEIAAKVTQNLIHQSSLDRAFPKSISEGKRRLLHLTKNFPNLFPLLSLRE